MMAWRMVSRCLLQRQLHGIVSLSCLSLSLLESLLFGVFFLDGGWTCVGGLILAFLASASSKWNADAVPSSWRVRFWAATVSVTQRLAGRLVFARTLRRGGAAESAGWPRRSGGHATWGYNLPATRSRWGRAARAEQEE